MNDPVFVFIGTETSIGHLVLRRFGQKITIKLDNAPAKPGPLPFDPEATIKSVRKSAPLLTEAEFNSHGFTDEDMKIWSDPFMSPFDMPTDPKEAARKVDFLRKRDAATRMYRDIQQGLLEPHERSVIDHSDGKEATAIAPDEED